MSTAVELSGASDDLIEVDGNAEGCDEYNADDAHFVLTGDGGSVRIRVWFTRRGVWAVAVAPTSEDSPMLPVKIAAAENGYSARAFIDGVSLVIREAERAS